MKHANKSKKLAKPQKAKAATKDLNTSSDLKQNMKAKSKVAKDDFFAKRLEKVKEAAAKSAAESAEKPAGKTLVKPGAKQAVKTAAKKSKSTQNKSAWSMLLKRLGGSSKEEAVAALKEGMHLILKEAKHASDNSAFRNRLRGILKALINSETTPAVALAAFQKYAHCLDVLQMIYELLVDLKPESFVDSPNKALNYLGVINLLDMGKQVLNANEYHIKAVNEENPSFDYDHTREALNTVWNGIIDSCSGVEEKVHRQVLVVLLERILPHLENPILLTDFLMDSLHSFDGPIALLALQGIFSLMQHQNITYPDVYKKLYNMFYPRIFYNKYKARLFYLADIFLTSTHLPENLVAAFVKRLARLSLKSPTEDAIIMIRFICNLLLRHTGLQRLISDTSAASAVEIADPYDESELDPVKSGALSSSLWEMVLLQKHAVSEVANAARFVSKSLPVMEFDLGPLLEMKECDIFDGEVKKPAKQFMLNYDRPKNFALPKNDVVTKYFNIL